MSPRVVLEAVGILNLPGAEPDPALWKLENKGPYDILTQRDESGRPARRLHVYACDYTVHEIEYFDRQGKVVAVAQLSGYEPVEKGFSVPTQINVVSTRPDGRKDSVVMELSSVRTKPFTENSGNFPSAGCDKYEHICSTKMASGCRNNKGEKWLTNLRASPGRSVSAGWGDGHAALRPWGGAGQVQRLAQCRIARHGDGDSPCLF
jgi:hypothetical protein